MNFKNVRKNYDALNERERASLFISAVLRKDASEEAAVLSASPKSTWTGSDFTFFYQRVLSLLMIVMIFKADAWASCQMFCHLDRKEAFELSRFSLYRFFVYKDAWAAICEELRINEEALTETLFPNCGFISLMNEQAEEFREFALNEQDAKQYVRKGNETKFDLTVESKVAEFRQILKLEKK